MSICEKLNIEKRDSVAKQDATRSIFAIPRTGEIVMLEGSIECSVQGKYTLSYIPEDSTITHGEAIETSGEGGIYPKGFLVGRVEKVYDANDGASKEAEGKSAVDFKKLQQVVVLKKK